MILRLLPTLGPAASWSTSGGNCAWAPWREEEREHRDYDAMRSDPPTVAMFGREWEEWPRHFSTSEECIQVHCRGLEKILLARLKEESEPEL